MTSGLLSHKLKGLHSTEFSLLLNEGTWSAVYKNHSQKWAEQLLCSIRILTPWSQLLFLIMWKTNHGFHLLAFNNDRISTHCIPFPLQVVLLITSKTSTSRLTFWWIPRCVVKSVLALGHYTALTMILGTGRARWAESSSPR